MEVLLFLKNVAVGFLSLYLAFANVLAGQIETFLGNNTEPAVTESSAERSGDEQIREVNLAEIPSTHIRGETIPRILIENTAYQRASALEGAAGTQRTAASVEEALVNIFCQYRVGNGVRTTTGTGFFIHENGAILTNAHVAQFLLLEEATNVEQATCVVRTGTPAVATYEAELLYFPPSWIVEHASLIRKEHPKGTGERDYALLFVSNTLNNTPLPSKFPALAFDTTLLPRSYEDNVVVAAGYPADNIFKDGPEAELRTAHATTSITTLFTFGTNYADLMVLAPSAVGQQGVSGGPVLDETGNIIGLIVTKGNYETDGKQSLRAITLSYIDRTITEETGFSLAHTLSGDLAYRGRIFKEALMPFLAQILAREIE